MFKNMGGKIKGWTKFVCWIGIILSVLAGILIVMSGMDSGNETETIISGIAVAVGGFLISWIGSFAAYGFGELVDNSIIQTGMMLEEEAKRRAAPSVPVVPVVPAQANGGDDDDANDLSKLEESIKF